MDIGNIVVLGFVVAQSAAIAYLVIENKKTTKKVDDMSLLLNKSIMASEEFRNNLTTMLDGKNKELEKTLHDATEDTRLQLDYQRTFIESSTKNTNENLSQILDTLEYLSTEVNIK